MSGRFFKRPYMAHITSEETCLEKIYGNFTAKKPAASGTKTPVPSRSRPPANRSPQPEMIKKYCCHSCMFIKKKIIFRKKYIKFINLVIPFFKKGLFNWSAPPGNRPRPSAASACTKSCPSCCPRAPPFGGRPGRECGTPTEEMDINILSKLLFSFFAEPS